MSPRRILITGGAGFIGSRLAETLAARGDAVTVLDSLSEQIHGAAPENSDHVTSLRRSARLIRGSVTDRAALEQALDGQEAVVHFAAETGTGQSMYQIAHYADVNVGGTALLLDVLANSPRGVRRMVVASSRSIYGEGRYRTADGRWVYPPHRSAAAMDAGDFAVTLPGHDGELELAATDEQSLLHPSSVYGITKQTQEQLTMTVCPSLGIEGVALRYQNVFGPGQSLSNPYTGILSIFSNLIMQGKPINVFEDGAESRDFVFVDDVVDATIKALDHPAAANEVFNVGTGVPISVAEVAETLVRLLGRTVPVTVTGQYRLGDIRHNYADLEKIGRLLGWSPQWSFERGITSFAAWASASGPRESGYERSLAEMRARGMMT